MMKNKTHFFVRIRGFTLIEMAIVLVIIGYLMAAFLMPLSAQMEQRRRVRTQAGLEQIKEALIGYALANQFLPCPDTALVPTGLEGARNALNQCVNQEGTLPWQALGIDGKDNWDRYIRYRVTAAFTDIDPADHFNLSSNGTLTVNSDVGTITTTAVAVIVSHGANGFGALTTTQSSPGNQMPAPAASATDEVENANAANNVFISHVPTPKGSANEFDDIVNWISPNILFNRMVTAGRLP